MKLKELNLVNCRQDLREIPAGKTLINTVNAYSYICALKDEVFADALVNGDYLVPDGVSIVMATRVVGNPHPPRQRVPGWDVFVCEMERLNDAPVSPSGKRPVAMFLGSSENVLAAIRRKAAVEYPNVDVVTYSPPFKEKFSESDNAAMVEAVNSANPDCLFIGMTAPKQEKWVSEHWDELDIHCHVGTVGAVFDFFAGTQKRAPLIVQKYGLEWLHRLLSDPRRMWRRYIIGNTKFLVAVMREKMLG
ncbi:MAG: WecB/TagA/CpsF family glycosyltransferase [Bacteroidales bacterium]|nr:WecB/TagA/CpsF family glycosyltransferase [Bacteroidales bacterium]MCM1147017.1 WecB/TagA/CpsF family glycosyltransferase [Bacteroidales bacterium]MCM1205850.1 WecB/TagA/CpsF family glycosyltransferase [Bacillota bacterium]MCM1509909.1 WecB/TagA/CpsF family glycosyltransferase [Clostridium sp.]